MMKFLLLILLLGILGCAGEGNETNAVYLAGEIVNPTDRFVVLLKGEQPLDTARLDSQNR